MRKWAILLALLAVVLAAIFVVSVSLWTRSALYAGAVSGYCVPANRLDRFRNGHLDPKSALAALIVVGDQGGQVGRIERLEVNLVRRLGFFFVSPEEQLSFIAQLPVCAASNKARRR